MAKKNQKDLPSWFCSEKYQKTKELTPQMWGIEFAHRNFIRKSCTNKQALFAELIENPFISEKPPKEMQGFINLLVAARTGEPTTEHGLESTEGLEGLKGQPMMWISDETSDIHKFGNGTDIIRPARLDEIFGNIAEHEWDELFDDLDKYCAVIDDRPKHDLDATAGYVRIDFASTNKQIKASMDKVIELYRDHLDLPEPTKHMTESKVRLFHQHRVLQVLDLQLWAEINDTWITDEVMAEKLFSDKGHTADNFRKNVKPLLKLAKSAAYAKALRKYDLLA